MLFSSPQSKTSTAPALLATLILTRKFHQFGRLLTRAISNHNSMSSHNGSSRNSSYSLHEEEVEPRSPNAPLPRAKKDIQWWDVTALVVNKMVGTGIFTAPGAVLLATQNKTHAIVFWVLGFLYTVLRSVIASHKICYFH
jgi:hypothetical protein